MKSTSRTVLAALLATSATLSQAAEDQNASLERVKTSLHFGLSASMAYGAERYFAKHHPQVSSYWSAVGAAFSVGATKEVVDHLVKPGAKGSGKDVAVDLMGAMAGAWLSQALNAKKDTVLLTQTGPSGGLSLTLRTTF